MRKILFTILSTVLFITTLPGQVFRLHISTRFLPPMEEISYNGLGPALGENGGSLEFNIGDHLGIELGVYGASIDDYKDDFSISGLGHRVITKYYLNPSSKKSDGLNLQFYLDNYSVSQEHQLDDDFDREVDNVVLGVGVGYKALSNFRIFLEGSIGYGFSVNRNIRGYDLDPDNDFVGFYAGNLYAKFSLGVRLFRADGWWRKDSSRGRGSSFTAGNRSFGRLKTTRLR